jgi:hypothetical protein
MGELGIEQLVTDQLRLSFLTRQPALHQLLDQDDVFLINLGKGSLDLLQLTAEIAIGVAELLELELVFGGSVAL